MRLQSLLAFTLVLAACGSDPDARKSVEEDQLTAKAVADVEGAMADTRPAPRP